MWLNGHEWAKRQARRARIGFTELANGFASCARPQRLQAICDRLGPADIQAFFDRWTARIPTPFTPADRAAGYWWELSMRQVEVSRTLVFDDPRRARGFFESLVSDNIGVGRPDEVRGRVRSGPPSAQTTKEPFRTRVFSARHRGQDGLRLQAQPGQAVPQGREGPSYRDRHQQAQGHQGPAPASSICPNWSTKARQVNDRLLMIERAGQGCAIGSALFERIHQPYIREGQRTGALPLRGYHAPWPWPAHLCCVVHAVTGFTNQSLRGLVAGLLGTDYSTHQMTYDLRRLRLHGLIQRIPHTNTYTLTPEGLRVAVFYTKLQDRLLRPLLEADKPPAPLDSAAPSPPSNTSLATTSPTRGWPGRLKLVTTSNLQAPKKI